MSSSIGFRTATDDILRTLGPPGRAYYGTLICLAAVLAVAVYAFLYQVRVGLGVAGYQPPALWGIYITNFVFWLGITHSGTLISAVLFLLRARWRTGVARASEAMTVFAIMTGGLFPIVHLGRAWLFYWLLPYPNQRELWVNFRSPIIWDLFAIFTYLTVSIVFLYVGLLPDIATARDRIRDWRRGIYRFLALGWSGSDRQWRHYLSLYGFLAALAVPLAVSVHSIVSWDFAVTILPGWHSTIFAPYFVAGAIFSGVAMIITLLVPLRTLLGLEQHMQVRHFEQLGKLLLTMSLILSYAYVMEFFGAWYSGSAFERSTYWARVTGAYAPYTLAMFVCNGLLPLTLWSRRVRSNLGTLFGVSIFALIGMWLERYVIVTSSLAHGFDPANWIGIYRPTWVEGAITAGSFALFFLLFLVFVKLFPVVSIHETKTEMVT
jgi:Ni/Fe-hydrogenase subunit HybB-like protein